MCSAVIGVITVNINSKPQLSRSSLIYLEFQCGTLLDLLDRVVGFFIERTKFSPEITYTYIFLKNQEEKGGISPPQRFKYSNFKTLKMKSSKV